MNDIVSVSGPHLFGKHLSAPDLLTVLLAVAMGISLVDAIIDARQAQLASPLPALKPSRSSTTSSDLLQLEKLFGAAPIALSHASSHSILPLTLLGSFVNADPQRSVALIRREGQQPEPYAVGAELEGDTYLHAVYADRIELERNGQAITLTFALPDSRGVSLIGQHDAQAGAPSSLASLDTATPPHDQVPAVTARSYPIENLSDSN